MSTEDIRFGFAAAMLLVASISDLRTRRVPNHYWFPFVGIAAAFVVGDLLAGAALLYYGIAMGLSALWYVLWWLRMYGGADMKGLIVLSFLTPFAWAGSGVPPALDSVTNGALLVMAMPIGYGAWNLVHGRIAWAALLGVRMSLARAERRQVWPLERAGPDGVRIQYWQRMGEPLPEIYHDLRRAGVSQVWATPMVPFMVPLLVGLLVARWHGNVVLQWFL